MATHCFPVDLQYLDRLGVSFCSRTTYDDNAITNAIEIYDGPRFSSLFFSVAHKNFVIALALFIDSKHGAYFKLIFTSGAVHFLASNNDCGVRDFDLARFQLSKQFSFPWPVNVSISRNLVMIVTFMCRGIEGCSTVFL